MQSSHKITNIFYYISVGLLFFRAPEIYGLKIADIFLILTLLIFAITHKSKIVSDKGGLSFFLLFILVVFTSSSISNISSISESVLTIGRLFLGFGLTIATFNIITSTQDLNRLINTIFTSSIISTTIGIGAVALWLVGIRDHILVNLSLYGQGQLARAMPFFYDPNHYASVLTISFVFAILCFAEASRWKRRISLLFLIFLFATGMISTGSRTAMAIVILCTVLSFLFYFVFKISKKLRLVGNILIFFFGIIIIAATNGDILDLFNLEFLGRRSGAASGLSNRFDLLISTLKTWIKNPIFGGGPGVFITEGVNAGASSHNSYAGVLSQFGIFGFISIISLFILVFKQIMRRLFIERSWIVFSCLMLFISFLAWGLFLNVFVSRRFWFVIGLVLTVAHRNLDVKKIK